MSDWTNFCFFQQLKVTAKVILFKILGQTLHQPEPELVALL